MVWAAGGTVSGVPANPNPAQIVNMSLGGSRSCRRDPLYQQAINQARNLGAMVVVSSGNSTANTANFSPASCSGVVTVGASNSETQRAYYSNFGPRTDVMAPGGSILISLNGQSQGGGVLSTRKGNSGEAVYSYLQGTSMAAPHVAGVLALMKSARPDLTPAEALDILKRTARPFSATQCSGEQGSQGGVRTLPPSLSAADCGAGLIDALAAVQAARAAPVPGFAVRPLASGFGVGAGGSRQVTVNLDRWGGFTTQVSLSVQGLPGGVTAAFSANPANSSSALQLTTSPSTAPGTYELTILGEGGGQSRSTAFTLVVGVSPTNQTLSGARITAFFWNGTTEILANSRYVTLSSNAASAPYTVSGLVGGSYYIEGWIDENGNGRYDDLDYIGNFLSGGGTAVVTAPRSDLNFALRPLLSLSSQSLQLLREGLQSRIFSTIQSPDPTSAARQGGEP